MKFHGQRNCVENNCDENAIFKPGRRDEPPYFVLYFIFRYVAFYRTRFQRELNTFALIFVQIAIFILLFSFVLKCDDHKTDENVDHEKRNDYNVSNEEYGHRATVVINWTFVFLRRIDRLIQQTRKQTSDLIT